MSGMEQQVLRQIKEEQEGLEKLQKELQKNQEAKQQYVTQQNENEMVLDELKQLQDDAEVYKKVGPALIRQELIEVKENVTKRLEFIQAELDKLDSQYQSIGSKMAEKRQKLGKMQQDLQPYLAMAQQQQQAA